MINPTRIHLNRRISCVGADGTEVTVIEYSAMPAGRAPRQGDSGNTMSVYFRTRGGRVVTALDSCTFQDAASMEIMRML